jgi:hypothetical protein
MNQRCYRWIRRQSKWLAAAREQDSREYLDTFDALKSVLPLGEAAPALGIVAHTPKPKSDERATGRAILNLLAGSYVLGSVPHALCLSCKPLPMTPRTTASSGHPSYW